MFDEVTVGQIESGVEMPPQSRSGKYAWASMKEGDSFLVSPCPARMAATIRSSGKGYCQRNLKGFTVESRRVDGGVRFWMVKAPEKKAKPAPKPKAKKAPAPKKSTAAPAA